MAFHGLREQSNSLTHLCKIICRETIEEYVREKGGLYDLKLWGENFCQKIQSSLEKAGAPWTTSEDELLCHEVRCAVAQIAKNHGRSFSAIQCRMKDKELIRQ